MRDYFTKEISRRDALRYMGLRRPHWGCLTWVFLNQPLRPGKGPTLYSYSLMIFTFADMRQTTLIYSICLRVRRQRPVKT